jgi:hypothetical protein
MRVVASQAPRRARVLAAAHRRGVGSEEPRTWTRDDTLVTVRVVRAFLAVATLTVAAAGCGEEASKTTPPVAWAEGVCTALSTWKDELEGILTRFPPGDLTFTEESYDQYGNELASANDTLIQDMESLGAPAAEWGEDAEKAVDDLAEELRELSNFELRRNVERWSNVMRRLRTMQSADTSGAMTHALEQAPACDAFTARPTGG